MSEIFFEDELDTLKIVFHKLVPSLKIYVNNLEKRKQRRLRKHSIIKLE